MKRILTYCIALLLPVLADAQSIPVNPKFGAVSKEEVEMETYARDTSAAIMLLYTCRSVEVGINMGGLYRNLLVHDVGKVEPLCGMCVEDRLLGQPRTRLALIQCGNASAHLGQRSDAALLV